MATPASIREFHADEPELIRRELLTAGTPCVLRGLVRDWPAVAAGRCSPQALVQYLARFDTGHPVDALMCPPEVHGRIFYNDSMSGFNFLRNRLPLAQVAEQVLRYSAFPSPPAVAAQSAPVSEVVPGFAAENPLGVVAAGVQPRLWLGNAITTPTHLDEWNNVGCVVSGRRRFTLFPPEQVANLYIGPLDFAPTGAPMSLVQLHAPDFGRFPRFHAALEAALTAELGPGDALYIPALWWHHVESLEPFNLLVNYWWHASGDARIDGACGFDALILAMLNLRNVPAATRSAWQALFEYYVFNVAGEPGAHIPAQRRGLLGALSAEDSAKLRAHLGQRVRESK
ncbi:MAG TPA: cupin-like domain-containing protein [Steroidobacteraceae bacterium]